MSIRRCICVSILHLRELPFRCLSLHELGNMENMKRGGRRAPSWGSAKG